MIARVKFTPNDPFEKKGKSYIDVKVEFPDGSEANVYAREDSRQWEALKSFRRGQIIEVEPFSREGDDRTFYRLTNEEIEGTLSGEEHPLNRWFEGKDEDMFDIASDVLELFQFFNDRLANGEAEVTPRVLANLSATTYIQYHKQS